jgi:hypothetical protein
MLDKPPASSTFLLEQTSHQPAVLLSQNKSAPAISHQQYFEEKQCISRCPWHADPFYQEGLDPEAVRYALKKKVVRATPKRVCLVLSLWVVFDLESDSPHASRETPESTVYVKPGSTDGTASPTNDVLVYN